MRLEFLVYGHTDEDEPVVIATVGDVTAVHVERTAVRVEPGGEVAIRDIGAWALAPAIADPPVGLRRQRADSLRVVV